MTPGENSTEREAKHLAISAAEFKVEEARFFLEKAAAAAGNARDFRFFFDAALDSIDAAKEIAKDVVGKDPVLKKVVGRRFRDFSARPETGIVIGNRIAAHHRYHRAALRGIIESGMAVTDLSFHDHVEYAVVVRPEQLPKDQRFTWTLVEGTEHYDALALCDHVLANLTAIISEIRARMGLPPDRGLKRFRIQRLKECPVIHRPGQAGSGGEEA